MGQWVMIIAGWYDMVAAQANAQFLATIGRLVGKLHLFSA
jgi:hypothetical protein